MKNIIIMNIFLSLTLLCCCEALVIVKSETSAEVGNFILEKMENFENFTQKILGPIANKCGLNLKPNMTTVNVKYSGNTYTKVYIVGDRVISNQFQLGIEFKEATFCGPIKTVVHHDYDPPFNEFTWLSKLPDNKKITRKYYITNIGYTVVMSSPSTNITAILHFKRT